MLSGDEDFSEVHYSMFIIEVTPGDRHAPFMNTENTLAFEHF